MQIRALFLIINHERIIIEHLLGAGFIRRTHGVGQPIRRGIVVRIDKGDILAARHVKTCIARRRQAAVFLMHLADAAIALGIRLHDRRTAILCAVVDENQLIIGERLREDTVQASGQIRLNLINRHDHTHPAHTRSPFQAHKNTY